jgi:hypothetical protein
MGSEKHSGMLCRASFLALTALGHIPEERWKREKLPGKPANRLTQRSLGDDVSLILLETAEYNYIPELILISGNES